MTRIAILVVMTLATILSQTTYCHAAGGGFTLRGRVVDRMSRQPIPFATVSVDGQNQKGAATDSLGIFLIEGVKPGISRLRVSTIGYRAQLTPDYIVSAKSPFIEVELEEDTAQIESVTVRPTPFRKSVESPVSMRVIGLQEIEKSPGANRDVSRIVRSYPGVAFSPVGYRNDLIVRGGGASENRFYMDGIEIPNINHFSTQGATGGPVSIVNADLVREIKFYTGAFPADRSGAMSSVLDFQLRDGDKSGQSFKATLGASEVSLSGSGHIGKQTTYLFSLRQSYLQLLFKALGLPLLPNYIDGQIKIKTRITDRDELTFLALAGIDNMKLNVDQKGDDVEYLLSYLPTIKQETYTVGAVYRHFVGKHIQSITLSHNYLNNRETKYRGNDSSTENNLTLRLRGVEQKSTLKGENRSYLGRWTVRAGAELTYSNYTNRTFRATYSSKQNNSTYATDLGLVGWGAYVGADYSSTDKRFSASAGLRADGCNYSPRMSQFWKQLSPRISATYALAEQWSVSGAMGLYHQLPPFTAMGFKVDDKFVNKSLEYLQVMSYNAGVEYRYKDRLVVSVEGFYKDYGRIPLCLADSIPLASKGADYGAVGDERLASTAQGRAYGVEAMGRWQIPGKVSVVGSFTWYRSLYRNNSVSQYIVSAWDNRFIVNLSGTYDLPRNWSIGARLSAIGGAPYTPYDEQKSSMVEAWNIQGRPYLDYARYNTERLDAFAQLDLRIDKSFYFSGWMMGFYIDLQNITVSKLRQPTVLMSTGKIRNPEAPIAEQQYVMKYLPQEGGTLLPTLGVTVSF